MTIILVTKDGKLEAVPESVYQLRDKIMVGDERRYSDEYFLVNAGQIHAHGVLNRENYALLGRSLGHTTNTTARIDDCPEFVEFRRRKNDKNRLMNTKTGDIYSLTAQL